MGFVADRDSVSANCRVAISPVRFAAGSPDVYWYYYFSGVLRAWDKETIHPALAARSAASATDEAYL